MAQRREEVAAADAPVTVQRVELQLPQPPGPRAPRPAAAAAWHDPAAAALASGAATLDAAGSVVFRTPEHLYPQAPAADTIQRQPDGPTVTPAAAQPGPKTETTPAPTAPERSSEQLEDLAKRVYDRISERLKTELRLDRERSGRLTDLSR